MAGAGATLGRAAWLLLVPAAELQRRGLLSYDGYNRLLVLPPLLLLLALASAPRALVVPPERSVRSGFVAAAAGVALLFAGNVTEFYGVLLQGEPDACAAVQAGASDHWVGSDLGWLIVGVGMLVLLAAGPVAAAG